MELAKLIFIVAYLTSWIPYFSGNYPKGITKEGYRNGLLFLGFLIFITFIL